MNKTGIQVQIKRAAEKIETSGHVSDAMFEHDRNAVPDK